jgi:L-amino acid N-acyltransferase YncA
MYRFTNRRTLRSIESLTALERQQLPKLADRMWGEDMSAEETFSFEGFGASCAIWRVERDGALEYDLWVDGDLWIDGVLFEANTANLVPVALIQRHFTSLVQGFEELAAALDLGERPQANSYEHDIREARESDAHAIVSLLTPIIAAGNLTVMESISYEEQLHFMREFPARGVFLVAEHTGRGGIDGLQSIEPMPSPNQQHVAEISTFVSMDAQRRHVGQTLMNETLRRAKENGFRKLMASVRADNEAAQRFYLSQGFSPIGLAREHVFVQGRYIDEYLLERKID